MKKRLPIVLALLFVAGLVLTGCSDKEALQQKDATIASLQDEVDQLQGALGEERAQTQQLQADLDRALSDLRTKEQVWMQEKEGLTHITLDGEVTFASGSTRLTTQGKEILDRIWSVLKDYPDRTVFIEGHTDNVPIAAQWQHRFRSNWELSSARANAVLHYVKDKYDLDAQRIGAVGYGEYRPIASNDTEDGRSMNRRVVITIGPSSASTTTYP